MNARNRRKFLPRLERRDGRHCNRCGRTPSQIAASGQDPRLVIDHRNNNNYDDRMENYQLLCYSCNAHKNHPHRKQGTPTARRKRTVGRTRGRAGGSGSRKKSTTGTRRKKSASGRRPLW